jgi:predicted DNA-binding protein
MYDLYIMKRTQIYIEEAQDARLGQLAAETGVRKSTLIREAIDAFLQGPRDDAVRLARFHAALEELERHPISLPDGRSYVESVRSADSSRQEELEHRRRA